MKAMIVYGLVDSISSRISYVGMSSGGMQRPKAHAKQRRIIILQEAKSLQELKLVERSWISHGRLCGWPLTNRGNGGEGWPPRSLSGAATERLEIRLTTDELRQLRRAAGNRPLATWVRETLLAAAR